MKTLFTSLMLTLSITSASAQGFFPCGILDPKCERQAAADDASCKSYGAKPGTPAYIACRTQLKTSHDTQRAIMLNTPDIINCTHIGFATRCNAF